MSDHGGIQAVWRKDGRELAIVSGDYFNNSVRGVSLADVLPGPEFRTSAPRPILTLPTGTSAVQPTPDFQRFLAPLPLAGRSSSVTVVFDWFAALEKK